MVIGMANVIVVGIVLLIIGAAIICIVREKKRGVRCIGCPAAGACSAKNGKASGCGGGCHSDT